MADDAALLREYARSGSEPAFAELVRRHVDLVYSTALRAVNGDQSLAKDVCQSVFVDLARKASKLSNRGALSGWLYTSACFAAAKVVRSERRRQARERSAQAMQEQNRSAEEQPDWEQIRPVVDSAMLELKESDREALLLRFFERHSLAEVGTRLGLSENAARMRIERALERLREQLTRRGITSTATALAPMLAHQTMVAAPLGLAATVTTGSMAAVAGAGAVYTLNLIAMSKAKTVLLGAVLAASVATPILLQHQTNARLKEQLESMRSQAAAAGQIQQSKDAAAEAAELERLRREAAELVSLRGEVNALRHRLAVAETTGSRVSPKQVGEAEQAKALLAESPDIPMVPASQWTNAGFATPAAALQTLNWAVVNHDTNAFGNALVWDAQAKARADALLAAAPESIRQRYGNVDEIIYDWWLNNATPIAAARVLSETDEGVNDTTLLEQHIYTDGRVRENAVQFQRDENGAWREVIPTQMMSKLAIVINSSPTTAANSK